MCLNPRCSRYKIDHTHFEAVTYGQTISRIEKAHDYVEPRVAMMCTSVNPSSHCVIIVKSSRSYKGATGGQYNTMATVKIWQCTTFTTITRTQQL